MTSILHFPGLKTLLKSEYHFFYYRILELSSISGLLYCPWIATASKLKIPNYIMSSDNYVTTYCKTCNMKDHDVYMFVLHSS